MYQSLYRKYRPKNFNEVIGQKIIVKTLINSINNAKISHAYLFTGPRGTGKTSIAKIFAKTINCMNVTDAIPCEKCSNCIEYNNKQNTDIIEIDAASNNGVDEIRELKNKIGIVPTNGKYKVYIIDEVHMLTVGAFNALLKTLEEPPSHVIFIMATTEPHKIPSTILSRCQRFDFEKISVIDIENHLKNVCEKENINISKNALNELARIADGGMRDALSLLEQTISYCDGNIDADIVHVINGTIPQLQLKNLFENLVNKDVKKVFEILDEYDSTGKNFIKVTDEFVLFLRNILLALQVPEYLKTINDNYEFYEELSQKIKLGEIIEYISIFSQNMNEMKLSNNPRLTLELVLIRIMNIQKDDTIFVEKQINVEEQPQKEDQNEKQELKQKESKKDKITIDSEIAKKLDNLIELRINNTLCNFDKKLYLERKNNLGVLNQYILIPEYSKAASLLIDGELKASSKNNVIFVFNNEDDCTNFNLDILTIDKMLTEIIGEKIFSIAVTTTTWNIIKKEYNEHLKKFEYKEEKLSDIEFLNNFNKIENSIEKSFKNLIQYN